MGIITFAGFNKQDPEHFWESEHIKTKSNRISVKKIYNPVLGGQSDSDGSTETTLDVEQSGAVAPQANIRVYEANFSDVGMANTFSTAFDENKAGSLSISWAISEYMTHYLRENHYWSPVYGQVFNLIFAQGALQGQSTFAASGDTGAYNQGIGGQIGPIQIPNYSTYGVLPSDNPWVTSTGGTSLPFNKRIHGTKYYVSIGKERAWGGDYFFPLFAKHRSVFFKNFELFQMIMSGGGGTISHLYGTPQYQQGVPGVNTFNARQYISIMMQPRINPILVSGKDSGRNYPDVSANADPITGYQIYQKAKKGPSWVVVGGTSAVAPQFNGITALINSGRKDRMGFWNAQIYQLAQNPEETPFYPMNSTTENSNLYYTGQPGTVYNQATGLGTVDFAKLAAVYK